MRQLMLAEILSTSVHVVENNATCGAFQHISLAPSNF